MGLVLVEVLKRRSLDSRIALPLDFDDRFQKGQFDGAVCGHDGSINEPSTTMRLYQERLDCGLGSSAAIRRSRRGAFGRGFAFRSGFWRRSL
jgi:hypothetical protein